MTCRSVQCSGFPAFGLESGSLLTGTTIRPELHQLEIFLKVAETKSFTATARLLGRTQPAISQAIARLEEIYGADLFVRRRGAPVTLTPVGNAILPSARLILHTADQHMQRAAATAQGRAGTLTLGFFAGLASGPLREAIAEFAATNPDVRLRLFEGLPSELHRQLSHGTADLVIAALLPDLAGSNFAQEDLWQERLFIALPAAHSLAGQSELCWNDIATLRLHLRAREGENSIYHCILSTIALPLDCEQHDVPREVLLDMVALGMGATVVFQSARVSRPDLVYVPICAPHDRAQFQAVWPEGDANPLRHRLLSILRKRILTAELS